MVVTKRQLLKCRQHTLPAVIQATPSLHSSTIIHTPTPSTTVQFSNSSTPGSLSKLEEEPIKVMVIVALFLLNTKLGPKKFDQIHTHKTLGLKVLYPKIFG